MTAPPVLSFDPKAAGPSVDLPRLVASRMLIQANSGAGKSWALRYLLEQTYGKIPHLVLDPEGEFSTLREKFPYLLVGKDGDVPADPKTAKVLCRRLMEVGTSAVLDIYDLQPDARRRFVRLFLEELMHLPRKLWRPLLVVVDEAHNYCPERGAAEAESKDAVMALCTQGRKRGFTAVLATQRLAKLHKDAAAELLQQADRPDLAGRRSAARRRRARWRSPRRMSRPTKASGNGLARVVDPLHMRVVDVLEVVYPGSMERDELAERLGYHPRAKSFVNALGKLRTLGVIDYPSRGRVGLTEFLFPEGA